LHIGANNGDTLAVALTNNTAATLVVDTNDITTQATASAAITALDEAINTVSTHRSNLAAMHNRLDSVTRPLAVASENTAAANSPIADADIASSISELVRSLILHQTGVSVPAQANQAPSMVLQLIKKPIRDPMWGWGQGLSEPSAPQWTDSTTRLDARTRWTC